MALNFTALTEATDTADLSAYSTASVSPAADNLILLSVSSGRTDGTAAIPSSISGVCSTWTQISTLAINNGNQRQTTFWGVSSTAEAITINFSSEQHNCGWRVVEVGGADTSNPIVQSSTAIAKTLDLPSTITSGNATCGFITLNSGSTTIDPGTGYTALGATVHASSPSLAHRGEYRLDGTQTVDFVTGGTFIESLVGMEIAAASEPTETTPWYAITAGGLVPLFPSAL